MEIYMTSALAVYPFALFNNGGMRKRKILQNNYSLKRSENILPNIILFFNLPSPDVKLPQFFITGVKIN